MLFNKGVKQNRVDSIPLSLKKSKLQSNKKTANVLSAVISFCDSPDNKNRVIVQRPNLNRPRIQTNTKKPWRVKIILINTKKLTKVQNQKMIL